MATKKPSKSTCSKAGKTLRKEGTRSVSTKGALKRKTGLTKKAGKTLSSCNTKKRK